MKKFFILATGFIIIVAAAYFTSCNNKSTSETQGNSKDDSVKKVLARGEYLVTKVTPCLDCHSKRDFSKYSGPVVMGTEGMGGYDFSEEVVGFPGHLYARNITPDPETGIGTWTDDEILRAMTQGISKNGDTLFPLMPYANFNHMAKSDLLSIIAYIKTLKPIKNKVPARALPMPMSAVYPAQALQPSVDSNMIPPESDKVHYGQYLVNAGVCIDCHTPMDQKGEYIFSKMFGGGFHFKLGNQMINTANITPDSATGIGAWSEERFLNKFLPYREEKNYNYDPSTQNTVMPVTVYAGMKDEDLKAIYAFLRTLKPINNMVEKYPKSK
jgi:hypothetical protein